MRLVAFERVHLVNSITFVKHERHGISRGFRFFFFFCCNMKDCSICNYCDEDFVFDEETGEEYPFYGCQKGNDTSLDYECKDFERFMRNDR